jgi:hypothetical protein
LEPKIEEDQPINLPGDIAQVGPAGLMVYLLSLETVFVEIHPDPNATY